MRGVTASLHSSLGLILVNLGPRAHLTRRKCPAASHLEPVQHREGKVREIFRVNLQKHTSDLPS